MSERDLQKAVAQYLDIKQYLWCHVPNGARLGSGKQAAMRGRRLKEEGLKPGVPDVLIFEPWRFGGMQPAKDPRSGYGVAIELKIGKPGTKRGSPTEEQWRWLHELKRRHWYIAVCHSLGEVIETCERLLSDVRR